MNAFSLVNLKEQHADELFSLIEKNRSFLRKHLPWVDSTRSVAQTKEFIYSVSRLRIEGRAFFYLICIEGEIVGTISINNVRNMESSISYWVSEKHINLGVATRACRGIVVLAKNMAMTKLKISCAKGNVASQKVAINSGFSYSHEGERVILNGEYIDVLEFRLELP
ncbi:GNAT family N-acetyltransferase [uncultured Pseudoteredinibacter sp.]|uniref:GNAT family N-acetyltransferase n=1 Tax=uncultured Pseudoteredinibacter sp. TaxID=1641701 RepID=UPI00260B270C|nr:GNAT family N-acetyltransferase [uncultured Pseudoteredinibacter sp.]